MNEKRRWHKSHWVKLIIFLLVLLFVFVVGYQLGKVKERISGYLFGYPMMGGYSQGVLNGAYAPMFQMMGTRGEGWGMMRGWYGGNESAQQVFGTISAVSGNQITVADNSGASQTILSTANTVIYSTSSGQEVGLANLKAGQNIRAIGTVGQDGKFSAQAIYVSSL